MSLDNFKEDFQAKLDYVKRQAEINKGKGDYQVGAEALNRVFLKLQVAENELPITSFKQAGKAGGRGKTKARSGQEQALNSKLRKQRHRLKFIKDIAMKNGGDVYKELDSQIDQFKEKTGNSLPTDYALWKWHRASPKGSGDVELYTPSHIIEAARQVMQGIDIDPASCLEANKTVQAKFFFTKENDGLKQPWTGKIWLNPPYTFKVIDKFIEKLKHEKKIGNLKQAIVLMNTRSETRWAQSLFKISNCLCLPFGRLAFKPHTNKSQSASMILGVGVNSLEFCRHFRKIGYTSPLTDPQTA